MPTRRLADYSTDELLYELLKLTRRQQWEADPLRFGCEVFGQHFTRSPAPMHRQIMRRVAGVGESGSPMNTSLPFPPSVSPTLSVPSPAHA